MVADRAGKRFFQIVAVIVMLAPTRAFALPIGFVSFDAFIPGLDDSAGVNLFTIGNLTEGFSLPPDFPVLDAVVLLDVTLTATRSDGTELAFDVGDVGPGLVGDPDLLVD